MKNFKSFLFGIICCLGVLTLQSNVSNINSSKGDAWMEDGSRGGLRVSLKYLHRDKTNQYYTLIITESSDPRDASCSVHTQLEPGIRKPYKK